MSKLLQLSLGDHLQLDELNCKVCQEPFGNNASTPRVLDCGHTFCSGCLKVFIKERPYCPDCRLPIKRKDINSFPVVYIVKQIMESINEINQRNLENGYSYLAEDCNIFEAHSGVCLNRDSNLFPSVGTCPLHIAPQQFWCSSCSLWICGSCAYLDHAKDSQSIKDKCYIISAAKHFKLLKTKQLERISKQISELKSAFQSLENFIKLVTQELEALKDSRCNNNFDEALLDKYKQVLSALASKKMELEASLEIVEDSKEKFNVRSLKQFHKSTKYLDSLWTCKNFPKHEDELIDGIFTQLLNKVPFILAAKRTSIAVSLKRDGKRFYAPLKFENNEIFLPSLKEGSVNGAHIFPFQEVKGRTRRPRAFMRLSRQGVRLGTVEIEVLENRRSAQFVMLCTGERGPSYRWTKFFASGGLFTRYLAGGDYEQNNGRGGAQIVEDVNEPPCLARMEDGIVCGEGAYESSVLAQFKIFYRGGSSPFARCPIGRVVRGLSLVAEVAASDLDKVYIEECGIIVPMSGD